MEPESTDPPAWLIVVIVVAFPIVFATFWSAVCFLLSRLAGWHSLAEHYAAGDREPVGHLIGGAFGKVGLTSYRGTLIFYFNKEGFFMDVNPLFRPGHKRLFIPWSEVSERKTTNFGFWKLERLSIGKPTIGTVSIPTKLLDSIPEAWS